MLSVDLLEKNEDVVFGTSVVNAVKNLKELSVNQSVGVHLREMYLAWLGSDNLNDVSNVCRPNYFESYEVMNKLISELEKSDK